MKRSKELQRLEEITPSLPPWVHAKEDAAVDIKMIRGAMRLQVYDTGKSTFGMAYAVIDRDSEVGEWTHPEEHKYLIVLCGRMDLTQSGVTETYVQGECAHILPGTPHSAVWSEETRMIDITFPPTQEMVNAC